MLCLNCNGEGIVTGWRRGIDRETTTPCHECGGGGMLSVKRRFEAMGERIGILPPELWAMTFKQFALAYQDDQEERTERLPTPADYASVRLSMTVRS